MLTVKDTILKKVGFVRFEGKRITRYKAEKLYEALSISALPEAHRKALELGSALQKQQGGQ